MDLNGLYITTTG